VVDAYSMCYIKNTKSLLASLELFTPNYEKSDYAVRDFSCIWSNYDDWTDTQGTALKLGPLTFNAALPNYDITYVQFDVTGSNFV
jgi:hypothetical protein